MAIASDLKAGQAVRVHGGNAVLESVDAFEMTAVVRREDGVTLTVNTADVSVQTPDETAAMEADRQDGRRGAGSARAGVRGPLGDRVVAVPTQAQITAARRAAVEKSKSAGEPLTAQQLIVVQEEAEAELVARMARGEPA